MMKKDTMQLVFAALAVVIGVAAMAAAHVATTEVALVFALGAALVGFGAWLTVYHYFDVAE